MSIQFFNSSTDFNAPYPKSFTNDCDGFFTYPSLRNAANIASPLIVAAVAARAAFRPPNCIIMISPSGAFTPNAFHSMHS